ncbi:MAG: class I SAM-dependent methyltransferase [Acidimicrobiales bacterium]|nr:class I SAM-dependent methyltransferase [Acidimicrobiales bacterium]
MPADNVAGWDRISAWYQDNARLPTDVATYGPGIPTEAELRLVGNVAGKRVVELGCGGAQCSIAFARQGAKAIGIDHSAQQLAYARRLAEEEEAKVELHHGDVADLAFLRSDTVDVVFSAYALGYVEDLNRVFRQVHRVLKPEAPFVFSVPHPVRHCFDEALEPAPLLRRSYFDRAPIDWSWHGVPLTDHRRTVSDIFTGLVRANFRVDTLLEPEPSGMPPAFWASALDGWVPRTLILRARKVGN